MLSLCLPSSKASSPSHASGCPNPITSLPCHCAACSPNYLTGAPMFLSSSFVRTSLLSFSLSRFAQPCHHLPPILSAWRARFFFSSSTSHTMNLRYTRFNSSHSIRAVSMRCSQLAAPYMLVGNPVINKLREPKVPEQSHIAMGLTKAYLCICSFAPIKTRLIRNGLLG
ncbi:hypothetical protein EI94DRAFT_1736372 [Lactarius quietus]|nr:hypothetical protein EI94DRAFT_1736372 [Lactarius quietus]